MRFLFVTTSHPRAAFRVVLLALSLTGHTVPLLGYGVSCIIEHFFDLRQRYFLWIVVDVDGLRRDIDLDLTHTFHFPNRSFYRVLAMLARNVGSHKCSRFHDVYPIL